MDLKRKDAGYLIDKLARELAYAKKSTTMSKDDTVKLLENVMKEFGIELPTECNGEAHSNPHADNCGVCMPDWGWRVKPTKVK